MLKNLLSNAFKFTEKGRVDLRVARAATGWSRDHRQLNEARQVIAFAVSDTGIGIAADKQRLIFDAFQQADGTTSRQYGGTGLGLSISREIAVLLGGELKVVSSPGSGSTFTLYLPQNYLPSSLSGPLSAWQARPRPVNPEPRRGSHAGVAPNGPAQNYVATAVDERQVLDDRDTIRPDDRVLLIVEDDARFSPLIADRAHQKGFKCIVAGNGEEALAMAKEFHPNAITLDIQLPEVRRLDFARPLEARARDAAYPRTHHLCEGLERGLKAGAIAHLTKPVSKQNLDEALAGLKARVERREKYLLVVEAEEAERRAVVDLLSGEDIVITSAGSGQEALAALAERPYDCVVTGMVLPDMTGIELLEQLQLQPAHRDVPVIVYSDKGLSPEDEESSGLVDASW